MASRFTEADAVAYAERHGVRLATARSALNVAPPVDAATAGLTCIAIRRKARAYAAEHGVSLGAAYQQLGLVEAYANAAAASAQKAKTPAEPADKLTAQREAAASVVALFNEANGVKHG